MDQFLERPNAKGDTEEIKRILSIKEIGSIINNLTEKHQAQICPLVKSTKHEEEVILIFYNLFQKTEAEGIFTKLFYDTSITLILRLDKDIT